MLMTLTSNYSPSQIAKEETPLDRLAGLLNEYAAGGFGPLASPAKSVEDLWLSEKDWRSFVEVWVRRDGGRQEGAAAMAQFAAARNDPDPFVAYLARYSAGLATRWRCGRAPSRRHIASPQSWIPFASMALVNIVW